MSVFRRKRHQSTIEARMNRLRADIDNLRADMRGLADGMGEYANGHARATVRAARRNAENAASHLADRVEDVASHLADRLDDNIEPMRDVMRQQPLTSFIVSVGAGALLGAILLRR